MRAGGTVKKNWWEVADTVIGLSVCLWVIAFWIAKSAGASFGQTSLLNNAIDLCLYFLLARHNRFAFAVLAITGFVGAVFYTFWLQRHSDAEAGHWQWWSTIVSGYVIGIYTALRWIQTRRANGRRRSVSHDAG